VGASAAAPAGATTSTSVVTAAANYAQSSGYFAGIAVFDTVTGRTFTGGHPNQPFLSASVVKVLIATRLLLAGRMSGRTAQLAYRMITLSDNDATNVLYPEAGGDGLEPWLAHHYNISDLGEPPAEVGAWGFTRLIPLGLARFYAKVKKDARVGPWLLNAMHHAQHYSAAGEYQWWGIPSATTNAAVKQGWNLGFGHANVNSTGFVNRDRYAVAIMTRGPTSSYMTAISRMITHAARLLLPGGQFPPPPPTITQLSPSAAPLGGGRQITVRGTDFTGVTRVLFGGIAGTQLSLASPVRLTVIAPAQAAGVVSVRVVTSHGTSAEVAADRFRYVAPPTISSVSPAEGPSAGGTTITVRGQDFGSLTSVSVGGVAAAVTSAKSTTIVATAPAHAAGVVDVQVVTAYGTSASSPVDHYTYDGP
jgi:hypothetical protein